MNKHDEQITGEIIAKLAPDGSMRPSDKPVIILLSGYTGSGKSTVVRQLAVNYGLLSVITDMIRYELTERGYHSGTGPFSEHMGLLTREIRRKLIIKFFDMKVSFVVEANLSPESVAELISYMPGHYKLTTVFLIAEESDLIERVTNRPVIDDMFKGDLAGLQETLKKQTNFDNYDLVLDTSQLSADEVASKIMGVR